MVAAIDVTVIVLNWNAAAETIACIDSVRENLGVPLERLVVVDNGSTDGSLALVRAAFPGIPTLEMIENLGFAGACSMALSRELMRGTSYVLLLNNDTRAYRDFLSPILRYLEANPKVGVCGPIITDPRTRLVQSAGVRLTPHLLDSRILAGGSLPANLERDSSPQRVDSLSGSALVLRVSALRDIGLFDSQFFFYEEETDLCVRARSHGYDVVLLPVAGLHHAGSVTAGRLAGFQEYHRTRSRLLLLRKHHSPLFAYFATIAYLVRQLIIRTSQVAVRRRSWDDLAAFLRAVVTIPATRPHARPEEARTLHPEAG